MEIYLSKEGVQSGPFDLEQIGTKLAQGQCQASDLAWSAGLPEWRPLEAILSSAASSLRLPVEAALPKPSGSAASRLSPLQTRGKIAGFWCIPAGSTFLKVGIPTQHDVEGEITIPTLLNARAYPACTILAQSPVLVEHFPWLSDYMRREMDEYGKLVFTAPGPARTETYLRLIKYVQEQGWSFVLQNGDTALLGAGSKLPEYASPLQQELSATMLCEPAHVQLQGIAFIAAISLQGKISDPLPLSEALGRFAQ